MTLCEVKQPLGTCTVQPSGSKPSVSGTSALVLVAGGNMIEKHLAWCRDRNLRPVYIVNRKRVLELVTHDTGRLKDATREDIDRWYTELGERVSPASRGVYLAHVRNYFQWLIREGVRNDDPTAHLMRPRLPRRLPRPAAQTDVGRAIENAPADIKPLLLLAAYMGLRCCEIAGLHSDHVSLELGVVEIVDGKGGKQRIVPLHPEVAAALPDQKGWYFPKRETRVQHCSPWVISRRINDYLKSQGISATAHQLRHYFGTTVYRTSKDLRLTQELMGHADPSTTAGYAAYDDSVSGAVVRSIGA